MIPFDQVLRKAYKEIKICNTVIDNLEELPGSTIDVTNSIYDYRDSLLYNEEIYGVLDKYYAPNDYYDRFMKLLSIIGN